MKKEQKDRHLETPAEANRDKHINFVALENLDMDPADMDEIGKQFSKPKEKKSSPGKKPGKNKG